MVRLQADQAHQVMRWLMDVIPRATEIPEPIKRTLEQIDEQINNPRHADDLFDRIAAILLTPSHKSLLTGNSKVIQQLKEAVLSPRELAKMSAISRTFQACTTCKKAILNGEVASLHGQLPYCYACMPPNLMSCGKCATAHPLPVGATRIMTKVLKECKCDGAGEVAQAVDAPGAYIELDDPVTFTEAVRRTNTAAAARQGTWNAGEITFTRREDNQWITLNAPPPPQREGRDENR